MAPAETLIAFALAAAAFAYFPGPALLYTAARTLAAGRRAGLMAALGINVGGWLHVLAAAAGLSALFEAAPTAYAALKLAGAAYLVWLGWSMIRDRSLGGDLPEIGAKSARRAFVESVVVEVLNPKVALFFIAFLPQFVDPAGSLPTWAQFLILGGATNLMFTSADLVCVAFAGAAAQRLRRSTRAGRWAKRAAGGGLMGLGAHLALSRG
ncbi:MAG: LysE family translocator [Pseudomonadota bacterium]